MVIKALLAIALVAICIIVIVGAELARELRGIHHGQASRRAGGAKSEG